MSISYVDESGQPRLRQSVTGFIDVLGFSHISTVAATLEESQQILDKISAAISDSRAFVREAFTNQPMADPSRWALKFFSDNLVFGFPTDTDGVTQEQVALFAVRCIQRYQLHMALNGFFVRGASTLGPICLTDEIIFGSALVDCYRLESKASIVPRVLLTEPLKDLLVHLARPIANSEVGRAICRDVDGWWFVNYLQAAVTSTGVNWPMIDRHKSSVMDCLSKTTAHDVLPKFGWTCRYHNVFCHWHRNDPGYSERFRVDRIDEESTIDLLENT